MNMDPFTSTILKQAAVIFGSITLLGLAMAITFAMYQLGQLRSAMELNPLPRPLD
jgi:hypothetical protein